MSSENEWRWADPLGQQRLVRTDELRSALAGGVIAPNTPVWRPGWKEWKPAYEVPELSNSANASANGIVQNIPPPPLFIVAAQHSYEDAAVPPARAEVSAEPPPPPKYVPSTAPAAPSTVTAPMPTVASAPVPIQTTTAPMPTVPERANGDEAAKHGAETATNVRVPAMDPVKPVTTKGATTKMRAVVPPPLSPTAKPSTPPPLPVAARHIGSASRPPPAVTTLSGSPPPPPVQPRTPSVLPPDEAGWDETVPEPKRSLGLSTKGASTKIPAARPSETIAGSRPPEEAADEANTGVDISALSPADAERLLGGGPSMATVHGVPALALTRPAPEADPIGLPPPPPRRPSSAPPTIVQSEPAKIETPAYPFPSTSPSPVAAAPAVPQKPAPSAIPPPLRSSKTPPPPPPMRKRGQTLLLYGGAPRDVDPPLEAKPSDPAPINVPAPGAQAPKAVTQAPPWNEGSAALDPAIPKAPSIPLPPMRAMADSIEEITGSVLLAAEDSGADVTQKKQKIEDLSDSHVLPDAPPSSFEARKNPVIPPAPAVPSLVQEALPGAARHGTLHAGPPPPPATMAPSTQVSPGRPEQTAGERPGEGIEASTGESFDPYPSSSQGQVPPAPPSTSRRILHDLNEIWAEPKKRWVAVAAGGTAAFVGLVILIAASSKGGGTASAGSPSGSSEAVVAVPQGTSGSPEGTRETKAPAAGLPGAPATSTTTSSAPCTVSGTAHVLAQKALIRMGIETAAGSNRLGLGFVTGEKDGLALALDPTTLATLATSKPHGHDAIKRLVPELTTKGVSALADADRKGEKIASPRTVLAEPTFVVGAAEGKLVWASRASDTPHAIWSLESDSPVEALRAVALEGGGFAVAFRQGAAIYAGATHADKTPNGALSRVPGLGSQIGSPALAASGSSVLVVWADHAGSAEPWMLRMVRLEPGQPPEAPRAFAVPAGGLGEHAMSPGVTSLAGGRFLLSWTEGPISSHQVRAQTLSMSGASLGPPLTISSEGVNAGQGQPVVTEDGRGVVVYMASPSGASAEVVATPIACPREGT